MKVVVVGAGIAGLSAAYDLVEAGTDVTVLESEPRAGGVIVTDRPAPGWVVEGGPDSVLAADAAVPALAAELGIADHLIHHSASGSRLWNGSALSRLSEGGAAKLLGIKTSEAEVAPGCTTFAGGMQELVDALMRRVGHAVRYRTGVTAIEPSRGRYWLGANGAGGLMADGVVVALPTYRAARLLRTIDPEMTHALGQIRYFPSLTVSLAYRRSQIASPLEGTGFVVQPWVEFGELSPGSQNALFRLAATFTRFVSSIPFARSRAGHAVRACTYSSNKFADRAPAGHVLLRAFLLPVRSPERVAHRSLAPILQISGEPLWARAYEWPRGLPRPSGNHPARLAKIRERLGRSPGLALAGAGYEGPSVSACVRSGRAAARDVLASLR